MTEEQRLKYEIIENYLATDAGRQAIAKSMCAPLFLEDGKTPNVPKYNSNRSYSNNRVVTGKIKIDSPIVVFQPPEPAKKIIRKMSLE